MIPGHGAPLDASHCQLCAMYHSNARYRQLVDGAVQRSVQPCRHVGERISGPKKALLGLDLRREWVSCGLGRGDPPGVTCSCKGCGPSCPDYETDLAGQIMT